MKIALISVGAFIDGLQALLAVGIFAAASSVGSSIPLIGGTIGNYTGAAGLAVAAVVGTIISFTLGSSFVSFLTFSRRSYLPYVGVAYAVEIIPFVNFFPTWTLLAVMCSRRYEKKHHKKSHQEQEQEEAPEEFQTDFYPVRQQFADIRPPANDTFENEPQKLAA